MMETTLALALCIIAALAAALSGLTLFVLSGTRRDLRDLGGSLRGLYQWTEDHFVNQQVCDERHKAPEE